MKHHSRVSPLTLLLCGIIGAGAGLLIQTYRSGVGHAPLSPPLSFPASLLVLAVVLLILASRLKKALGSERTTVVNPFHAIRLLAAARAAQFTGSLCAGFGLGLIVTIVDRMTQLSFTVWLPMVLTTVFGAVLVAAGVIAENACRIPPEDGDEEEAAEPEEGTAPGSVSAYRAHDDYS